jgi:hypothetical protein
MALTAGDTISPYDIRPPQNFKPHHPPTISMGVSYKEQEEGVIKAFTTR